MSSQGMHAGLAAITNERSNAPIITRFLRFAVALAVLPTAVYFGTVQVLSEDSVSVFPRGFTPPIIGGIAAVLVINLIIAIFALLAVLEPARPPQSPLSSDSEIEPVDDNHSKDD